jgi:hypothetical protein
MTRPRACVPGVLLVAAAIGAAAAPLRARAAEDVPASTRPTPTPGPPAAPEKSTPTPAADACVAIANDVWGGRPLIWQSGVFTAEFEATADRARMDGLVGLALGEPSVPAGLAAAVRFNPAGKIDARNGAAFAAAKSVKYAAGTAYRFRLVVDVPARTYSVFVRPKGGAEVGLATRYAFGGEANANPRLDNWRAYVEKKPGGTLTVCGFTARPDCAIASTSALFDNFKAARRNGTTPTLPDFSYAGYRRSEEPIPTVSGTVFDVTRYGATPNDATFDDAGIQAAIDAAEAAGGGIVYFPPGQFRVGPNEDPKQLITIEASHIVLRGAGSGAGGTEILMVNKKQGTAMFVVSSPGFTGQTVAKVTADVPRESFWAPVDDTASLRVGQWLVLRYQSPEYNSFYFDGRALDPDWERIVKRGVGVHEVHQVAEIAGNKVRFREPLHFDIKMGAEPWRLDTIHPLEEVGIEDIRFSGSWDTYPEPFDHHKDWIHDNGWHLVSLRHVVNSWVRRAVFHNFNVGCTADNASFTSFENLSFTGKKGHTSVGQRRGYGLLVRDATDTADTHHGPDAGYNAVSTVFLRYDMRPDQSLDFHGGVPHGILVDDTMGGMIKGSGGPIANYPHTGRYTVLWNFFHRSGGDYRYDMWNVEKRNSHTYTLPILVGFRASTNIAFEDESTELQANESMGTAVAPKSLFEAQLALRTCQ